MFVPDVGDALNELVMDDMLVDPTIVHSMDMASTEAIMSDNVRDTATSYDGDNSMRGTLEVGEVSNTIKTIDLTGVARPTPQYKEALAQLELLQDNEETNEGSKRGSDKVPMGEGRGSGGGRVGNMIALTDTTLLPEIDRIMAKVKETMAPLEDNEGNKRVRRTIESSNEVRTLVKHIKTECLGQAVEGARVDEDKVALFVASESSEESGGRKRKHREVIKSKHKVWHQDRGRKTRAGVRNAPRGVPKKAARMVARKIKASAKKPSTSLTLAPPTLGLPNE